MCGESFVHGEVQRIPGQRSGTEIVIQEILAGALGRPRRSFTNQHLAQTCDQPIVARRRGDRGPWYRNSRTGYDRIPRDDDIEAPPQVQAVLEARQDQVPVGEQGLRQDIARQPPGPREQTPIRLRGGFPGGALGLSSVQEACRPDARCTAARRGVQDLETPAQAIQGAAHAALTLAPLELRPGEG